VRIRRRTLVANLCALHLAAAAVHAGPCEPPIFGEAYASPEAAATATLRALYRAGGMYESGGFVVEHGGGFRASRAVTQRSRSDVSYCIMLPRGATLAGLYHTHVGRPELSARDVRNSERAGVPSFIGTIRDGAVIVYDPELDKVNTIDDAIRPRQAQTRLGDSPASWFAMLEHALRGIATFLGRTWAALAT
jgi:proteasome lid subunit RPN8/RPN11